VDQGVLPPFTQPPQGPLTGSFLDLQRRRQVPQSTAAQTNLDAGLLPTPEDVGGEEALAATRTSKRHAYPAALETLYGREIEEAVGPPAHAQSIVRTARQERVRLLLAGKPAAAAAAAATSRRGPGGRGLGNLTRSAVQELAAQGQGTAPGAGGLVVDEGASAAAVDWDASDRGGDGDETVAASATARVADAIAARARSWQNAFRRFPRQGDGSVSVASLVSTLQRMASAVAARPASASSTAAPPASTGLSAADADSIVRLVDPDGTGSVSFHKFAAVFSESAPSASQPYSGLEARVDGSGADRTHTRGAFIQSPAAAKAVEGGREADPPAPGASVAGLPSGRRSRVPGILRAAAPPLLRASDSLLPADTRRLAALSQAVVDRAGALFGSGPSSLRRLYSAKVPLARDGSATVADVAATLRRLGVASARDEDVAALLLSSSEASGGRNGEEAPGPAGARVTYDGLARALACAGAAPQLLAPLRTRIAALSATVETGEAGATTVTVPAAALLATANLAGQLAHPQMSSTRVLEALTQPESAATRLAPAEAAAAASRPAGAEPASREASPAAAAGLRSLPDEPGAAAARDRLRQRRHSIAVMGGAAGLAGGGGGGLAGYGPAWGLAAAAAGSAGAGDRGGRQPPLDAGAVQLADAVARARAQLAVLGVKPSQAFLTLDRGRRGALRHKDVAAGLARLGVALQPGDPARLLQVLDAGGSGLVTYAALQAALFPPDTHPGSRAVPWGRDAAMLRRYRAAQRMAAAAAEAGRGSRGAEVQGEDRDAEVQGEDGDGSAGAGEERAGVAAAGVSSGAAVPMRSLGGLAAQPSATARAAAGSGGAGADAGATTDQQPSWLALPRADAATGAYTAERDVLSAGIDTMRRRHFHLFRPPPHLHGQLNPRDVHGTPAPHLASAAFRSTAAGALAGAAASPAEYAPPGGAGTVRGSLRLRGGGGRRASIGALDPKTLNLLEAEMYGSGGGGGGGGQRRAGQPDGGAAARALYRGQRADEVLRRTMSSLACRGDARALWRKLDVQYDGTVAPAQLREGLARLGVNLPASDFAVLLRRMAGGGGDGHDAAEAGAAEAGLAPPSLTYEQFARALKGDDPVPEALYAASRTALVQHAVQAAADGGRAEAEAGGEAGADAPPPARSLEDGDDPVVFASGYRPHRYLPPGAAATGVSGQGMPRHQGRDSRAMWLSIVNSGGGACHGDAAAVLLAPPVPPPSAHGATRESPAPPPPPPPPHAAPPPPPPSQRAPVGTGLRGGVVCIYPL